LRLARKELRECLRDRRTLVTLVLMPLLLYPLLGLAFRQFFASWSEDAEARVYRIGVGSEQESQLIVDYLLAGQAVRTQHPNWPDAGRAPGERGPQFDFRQVGDMEDAVRRGMVALGIRVRAVNSPTLPNPGSPANWELVYVPDSAYAREALRS